MVSNKGLGPALISDVLYYVDGCCHTMTSKNIEEFAETDLNHVIQYFGQFYIEQFQTTKWANNWTSPQGRGFKTELPLPSQIIAMGQGLAIAAGRSVRISVLAPVIAESGCFNTWVGGRMDFGAVTLIVKQIRHMADFNSHSGATWITGRCCRKSHKSLARITGAAWQIRTSPKIGDNSFLRERNGKRTPRLSTALT